jgi:hypothetical protein
MLDSLPDAPATKVMLRVLGMDKGNFAVRRYQRPAEVRLDLSVPELLVDGLFKLDELEVLRQRLPADDEGVVLAKPMLSPLSALEEQDLDMIQLAHNHTQVGEVMDRHSDTDLETAKRLLALLDGGYLRRA